MPKPEALPGPLQESIIAALIFDAKWGAMIAVQIKARHFDAGYQDLVGKVLSYRQTYRQPPGAEQLDVLLGDALTKGDDAHFMRKLVGGIVQLKDGLNAEFIANRVHEHVRKQELKATIMSAGERFAQGGEGINEEVEKILAGVLFKQRNLLDTGTFLGEERALEFLDANAREGFKWGIRQFDDIGLRIAPKKLILFIGAKGAGKSWACVHVGRQGLIHNQRVLHVTLEMEAPDVIERYVQMIFGGAWGPGPYQHTQFELDDLGRLTGIDFRRTRKPVIDFKRDDAKAKVRAAMKPWGIRLNRIVVKEFATGSLTIAQLVSYMDYLEAAEGFIPNVLALDYPDLMEMSGERRFALSNIFIQLRKLAHERNLTVFAPTQGNRAFLDSTDGSASQVSEDISKLFTSDIVLVLRRTKAEERIRTGRLLLEFSRKTIAGIMVLISQNYSLGQFICDSVAMPNDYWKYTEKDKEAEEDAE